MSGVSKTVAAISATVAGIVFFLILTRAFTDFFDSIGVTGWYTQNLVLLVVFGGMAVIFGRSIFSE